MYSSCRRRASASEPRAPPSPSPRRTPSRGLARAPLRARLPAQRAHSPAGPHEPPPPGPAPPPAWNSPAKGEEDPRKGLFSALSTPRTCPSITQAFACAGSQHNPSASEEAQRPAGTGQRVTEDSHLLLPEDNLVEEVLEALVCIVDAQLLEAVEAQVLPGRVVRLGPAPPWPAARPSHPGPAHPPTPAPPPCRLLPAFRSFSKLEPRPQTPCPEPSVAPTAHR